MGNNNYFPGQQLKFDSSLEADPILNNLKNLYIDKDSLIKNKNDNLYIEEIEGTILKSLDEISRNELFTRSEEKKKRIKDNDGNFNDENIKDFIPINYEIIPEKIMNFMFDQGDVGICYLVGGVNACIEIPNILDHLFIDKDYLPKKQKYEFNAFVNSVQRKISLNNKFLYKKIIINNKINKLKYKGCQTFKYELFLKFIVKLFAELNSLNNKNLYNPDECEYSKNKLKYIEGGWASEIYGCIFGTSSTLTRYSNDNKDEYINTIEKNINKLGNILTIPTKTHLYAIKNMIEYCGNGEKKKFVTLYNPWGSGNVDIEFFDFKIIKEETKNFEYISKFNENYSNTGLIKIPLNLFSNWFTRFFICSPKYGFH